MVIGAKAAENDLARLLAWGWLAVIIYCAIHDGKMVNMVTRPSAGLVVFVLAGRSSGQGLWESLGGFLFPHLRPPCSLRGGDPLACRQWQFSPPAPRGVAGSQASQDLKSRVEPRHKLLRVSAFLL
jgi:hypothetical protein